MVFWIHSLLCLILTPIDRNVVFAPANTYSDTMSKGGHDDEKLLNYTSVFDGIFSNIFFPTKYFPIYTMPFFFFFSSLFWAFPNGFEKHFTTDQFKSYILHVFTSHPPSSTENGAGCLPPPAVFRGNGSGGFVFGLYVCVRVMCLCVYVWVKGQGGSWACWRTGCGGNGVGCAKFRSQGQKMAED